MAFLPGGPYLALAPDLALALFVAPVLLDAAYDASLRDLKDNWASVAGLALVAVGLTTAAVALVAHALVPGLPWAAAPSCSSSAHGVWMLAERIGLSGVLTIVCYAIAIAREAPDATPARLRVPSYAV